MARWVEPQPKELAGYRRWVASRPPDVKAVAERFEPWSLYRLKPTGQRVIVLAFGEGPPVTLRVLVSAQYNLTMFEREVFGINPDDLEPCEIPSEDEITGALLTPEQVEDNIDSLRVQVRPDLWAMDADGKAVRKP